MIEELLDKEADVTLADNQDRTVLRLAAEYGNKEVVDLLLERRPGCTKKDAHALRIAVENGAQAAVKTLLEHRNVDGDDDLGIDDLYYQNLLQRAVKSGNKDVAWYVAEKMITLMKEANTNNGI